MKWFKDEDFIRGEVPMTKFIKRNAIVSLLDVSEDDKVLEIGTGTGSVTCQMAAICKEVTTIERDDEAISIAKKNFQKFGLNNIKLIKGKAPEGMDGTQFNKVYIGGSGKNLESIMDKLDEKNNFTLIASFIIFDNAYEFKDLLKKKNYKNIDTYMINVSKAEKLEMMIAENPVIIVRGEKND
ncbi:MAG: rRNA adenine N-6-methyltransferase family protein [Eubacteriales bacterium]|uniref:bifunctional cobalt-precorrin-7 (C(5))-methyltransferase/cobalt-precorrin-6B (C(15))-methyltransferase n=1 Tax=Fenollaria sp. TaxID=1965292 RepID=UPI002A74CE5A|nr:rRNA adenine N-6-methyltransferase family protein [Fenollaria sp.]MDD7338956.1 rRNA adenine N-6-methyltransferase family protein [Eubacteriales bacterium]MDY3106565.1 rRNA adenine N-6-methyltransferase family protein [Fenollaria sp.]